MENATFVSSHDTKVNVKKEKQCYHCKRNDHHRSLWPNLFNGTNGMISQEVQDDAPEEIPVAEEGLLSAGENVIMKTALVEAMDSEHLHSEVTRIMMDSGGSRTYVTEDMVKKLKLEIRGSNKLSVNEFFVTKPLELRSPIVKLVLKSKYGNTFTVIANVVKKISGRFTRHPINLKDELMVQRKYRFADTLPTVTESCTIGVLIGQDYYDEIMSSEKTRIQDGLFVQKSKFGWMISGRAKNSEHTTTENNFFVMTLSSSNILPEMQQFTAADDSLPTTPNIDEFWKLKTIFIAPREIKKDVDDETIM